MSARISVAAGHMFGPIKYLGDKSNGTGIPFLLLSSLQEGRGVPSVWTVYVEMSTETNGVSMA